MGDHFQEWGRPSEAKTFLFLFVFVSLVRFRLWFRRTGPSETRLWSPSHHGTGGVWTHRGSVSWEVSVYSLILFETYLPL